MNLDVINKQLKKMESIMTEERNGCLRLNFAKDILLLDPSRPDTNIYKRALILKNDLKSKADLIKKIYKFEKQMFLAQGRISGQIPQTQDLVDEIHMRDNKGYIQ